jgi:hypothetical protein
MPTRVRLSLLKIVGLFAMLAVTVLPMTAAAGPNDPQQYTIKQLFDIAANPLGWRSLAGKTVAMTGGLFFNMAPLSNGVYLMSVRASIYTPIVASCGVSKDSEARAATLKLNDPVILIGKLAGAPQGNAPAFDGTCEVYSGIAPVATAPLSHGPVRPDITVSIDKLEEDSSNNEAAFNSKYIGKVVRLTGVKVSHVGTDMVTVYHRSGPNKFPVDVVNCFPSDAGKAGLATLNKDQNIIVTGVLKPGDFTRAPGTARIMDDCSLQ